VNKQLDLPVFQASAVASLLAPTAIMLDGHGPEEVAALLQLIYSGHCHLPTLDKVNALLASLGIAADGLAIGISDDHNATTKDVKQEAMQSQDNNNVLAIGVAENDETTTVLPTTTASLKRRSQSKAKQNNNNAKRSRKSNAVVKDQSG
jgi:hypothetical protein